MADNGFSAGSIFVAFKATVDDFQKGLKSAIDGLKAFGSQVSGIAGKVATVGRSITAALTAPIRAAANLTSSLFTLKAAIIGFLASKVFDALVTGPAEAAVELGRMAARAGIAADQLEKLQFVVSAAGGRGDDVSIGLEKLNKILEDTRRGATDFVPILQELGFEGLSIDQIVNKIFSNPNLSAGGLKKLGIPELAVLAKLSREEIEKLLVSFVRLGNGTDSTLFSLGDRLRVVTTQLKEALGNVFEQVSKLILPPLLNGLEFVERWIEAHFPEIEGFFKFVTQQAGFFFEAVKRTAEEPTKLVEALQTTVERVFQAIGDVLIEVGKFIADAVVGGFRTGGAAAILLVGPLFQQLWVAVKLQLDHYLELATLTMQVAFEKGFTAIAGAITNIIVSAISGLASILESVGLDSLAGKLRSLNLEIVVKDATAAANRLAALQRQNDSAQTALNDATAAAVKQFDADAKARTASRLETFKAELGTMKDDALKHLLEIKSIAVDAASAIAKAFGFSAVASGGKTLKEFIDEARAATDAAVVQQKSFSAAGGASVVSGAELPPGFVDTTSPAALEALTRQLQENDALLRRQREEDLVAAEAKINTVIGGLFDGIRGAMNDLFVEGKSKIEALSNFAGKLADQFMGNTIEKLQSGLSKGIAAAFNNPAVGGAVADLASALIGIGATVVSIITKKKSSNKSFNDVGGRIESTQALRGIVAGPSNIAIAQVAENIGRALVPTNNILTDILSTLRLMGRGGSGGSGFGGFGFAGSVATT